MQPPFLAALLAASAKEHEQMWTQLLRVAFDAFSDFSFLDTSALAGRLGALNTLTQPQQLQAAMVRFTAEGASLLPHLQSSDSADR